MRSALFSGHATLEKVRRESDIQKILSGKILALEISKKGLLSSLHESEFKVFSQWGDDGTIQYLIHRLNIPSKTFVEFGVEDYREANTRFLLQNNNWSGLVMDSSRANIESIKKDDVYWKYDLSAQEAFVDAENINDLLRASDVTGEIGLLHIDIDGNDYWVWKALAVVSPVIAIIEYNSIFGIERPITVPYEKSFSRTARHHSNLYFGASLLTLCDLAKEKGYCFVGCNSSGNNAYFIRKDRVGDVPIVTPEKGYVESKFREHRDARGNLTFTTPREAVRDIRGLPVFNTRENRIETF